MEQKLRGLSNEMDVWMEVNDVLAIILNVFPSLGDTIVWIGQGTVDWLIDWLDNADSLRYGMDVLSVNWYLFLQERELGNTIEWTIIKSQ